MILPTLRFAAIAALLAPSAGSAASLIVDTTADEVAADGNCSLREAILAANSDTAVDGCAAGEEGGDEILLGAGTFRLALSTGGGTGGGSAYEVADALTIRGAGAEVTVIDGDRLDRIFDVLEGGSLRLEDLTLTNAEAPAGATGEVGGHGGAIRAAGALHIERCVLADNRAGRGGTGTHGGDGGAIHSTASIALVDSVLQGNVSGGGGPSSGHMAPPNLPGIGGAIATTDTLTIDRSRIEANHLGSLVSSGVASLSSGRGAAISAGGTLVIRDSSIVGNGHGGHPSERGVVWAGDDYTIVRTSFVGNLAARGAALFLAGSGQVTNVVVADNESITQTGAIFPADGFAQLHSLTVTGNLGGGLVAGAGSTVMFRNSILRGNLTGTGGTPWDCDDREGTLSSRGYNLLAMATNCPSNSNDLLSDEPALLELASSEHFVPGYVPLLASSRAVDGGHCGPILPQSPGVSNDILGKPRPPGGPCSIGALEYADALLFRVDEESAGTSCPDGGSRIAIGLDRNSDGILDEDEVESFAFVCHGGEGAQAEPCTVEADGAGNAIVRCPDGTSVVVPAGSPALVRLVEEPAGENCAAGGTRVEAGRDLDGDGALAAHEVESSAWICSGADGANGADGADGLDGADGSDAGDGTAASCTVEKTKGGGARITCPDGSGATVAPPGDDGGCAASGGDLTVLGLALSFAMLLLRRRSAGAMHHL